MRCSDDVTEGGCWPAAARPTLFLGYDSSVLTTRQKQKRCVCVYTAPILFFYDFFLFSLEKKNKKHNGLAEHPPHGMQLFILSLNKWKNNRPALGCLFFCLYFGRRGRERGFVLGEGGCLGFESGDRGGTHAAALPDPHP